MSGFVLLVLTLTAAYPLIRSSAHPPIRSSAQVPDSTILAGQRLLYAGRFEEAQAHFAALKASQPASAVGPVLEAATLIWWGEATGEETRSSESIAILLDTAVA